MADKDEGILKRALRERMQMVDAPDNDGPPPPVQPVNTHKKDSKEDTKPMSQSDFSGYGKKKK